MVLLKGWAKEGRMVIAVLHDIDLIQENFTHTLLLARRFYKAGLTHEVLTKENLRAATAASREWEELTSHG